MGPLCLPRWPLVKMQLMYALKSQPIFTHFTKPSPGMTAAAHCWPLELPAEVVLEVCPAGPKVPFIPRGRTDQPRAYLLRYRRCLLPV